MSIDSAAERSGFQSSIYGPAQLVPPLYHEADLLDGHNVARLRDTFKRSGRLADKVVASQPAAKVLVGTGSPLIVRSVGCLAAEIAAVPARYVLKQEVSDWCAEIVRSEDGFLSPDNPRLRMPLPEFWIEWQAEGDATTLGALVQSDLAGRRGSITGWWERPDGIPDLNILTVDFDLDSDLSARADGRRLFRLRHASLSGIAPLMDHCLARLDDGWAKVLRRGGQNFEREIGKSAEGAWHLFPFVLAFCTILESRTPLRQTGIALDRLNKSRARRGRRPRLDLVEVSLDLARIAKLDRGVGEGGLRAPPRLHAVRGHSVRRGSIVYWRAPHLRGMVGPTGEYGRRTVIVSHSVRADQRFADRPGAGLR